MEVFDRMEETVTARAGEERALLRFLDKVFARQNLIPYFKWLLPKLFRAGAAPCPKTLVVRDEKNPSRFRAAVGLYMIECAVGSEKLLAAGIGNVAVGKRYRGMGYMKLLMRQALELARARGADYSVLNGLRHRYQYFGYERVGCGYDFKLTKTSLRHSLHGTEMVPLTVEKLRREDTETLAAIHALNETSPVYCARPDDPAALWDTLTSWFAVPYILRREGAFAGYFQYARIGFRVEELRLTDAELLGGAVTAILAKLKRSNLVFRTLPTEAGLIAGLTPLCETVHIQNTNIFNVLNYTHVLEALLRLKARSAPLCEGELVLRVNGFFEAETLRISVRGGEIAVTPTDEAPALALEHLAAMRCFFAPVAPERALLPAYAASWFPLLIDMPYMDTV